MENCPFVLKGQYYNKKDSNMAKVTVAAWCYHDLYVWSWFSGRSGTKNDKTLLSLAPLFMDILPGSFSIFLPMSYNFCLVRLKFFFPCPILSFTAGRRVAWPTF